jgi:hypothetical protein
VGADLQPMAYVHLSGEAVELLERSEALAREVFAPLAERPGRTW